MYKVPPSTVANAFLILTFPTEAATFAFLALIKSEERPEDMAGLLSNILFFTGLIIEDSLGILDATNKTSK